MGDNSAGNLADAALSDVRTARRDFRALRGCPFGVVAGSFRRLSFSLEAGAVVIDGESTPVETR